MLRVEKTGLLTTLQDTGRPGSAHLGIGRSGAADLPALLLANALVGNPRNACALEMTLLGPCLRCDADAYIALTGAPLPHANMDGAALPMWQAVPVPRGATITLGAMPSGCRSYLAMAGGIDVAPWRRSRCTDINAALGPVPRALAIDDKLPVGRSETAIDPAGATWSLDPRPWFDGSDTCTIRLLPGSHSTQLDATSRIALTRDAFHIGRDSNRVGARLDGPRLALQAPLELISEGMVAGTMQLPPDGRPIIMGCEHPVTGGYPRIAQVAAVDLPRLAQCRPGDTVRFQWIEMAQAAQLLAARHAALDELIAHIHTRNQST